VSRFIEWVDRHIDVKLLEVRVAEGLREAALLWFVFSLLDKLVNERLTKPWMIWNCTLTLVVWLGGTYLEIRRRPETPLKVR
jgi:hypothetical protein